MSLARWKSEHASLTQPTGIDMESRYRMKLASSVTGQHIGISWAAIPVVRPRQIDCALQYRPGIDKDQEVMEHDESKGP